MTTIGLAAIAASTATEIGKGLGSDLYDTAKTAFSSLTGFVRSELQLGISQYIAQTRDNVDNVKTIINRYQPVPLTEIYEEVNIVGIDRVHEESALLTEEEFLNSSHFSRCIISGTAGSGKSFFMRRLLIRFTEEKTGYLPIFLELRSINSSNIDSIHDHCFEKMRPHIAGFDRSIFEHLMEKSKIAFFFDGFDELNAEHKSVVAQAIQKLAYENPRCKIFVSSRPDDGFFSWGAFSEFLIAPLTMQKCISLVRKARFPEDEKEAFANMIRAGLFESHEEYLRTPLMTYVMLLTSNNFVEFPQEMSTFYEKAFEMLFSGHDVMKPSQGGRFKREVNCNISIKKLALFMGYFCALSLRDEVYEYSGEESERYARKAIELSDLDCSEADIMEDIRKAYCLTMRDGANIRLIHKTFQEYFAADCLSKSEKIDYFEYNSTLLRKNIEVTKYLLMLNDVGRERFVERFLVPILDSFIDDIFPLKKRSSRDFMRLFFDEFSVDEQGCTRLITFSRSVRNGWRPKWFSLVADVYPMVAEFSLSSRPFFANIENPSFTEKIGVKARHKDVALVTMNFESMNISEINSLCMLRHTKEICKDLRVIRKDIKDKLRFGRSVIGGYRGEYDRIIDVT